MMVEKPKTGRNALLVIDIQDSFKVGSRWEMRSTPGFETNVRRLIAGFREAHQPVIYFLTNDNDDHFHTGSPAYRLMSFLQPLPNEPVLHKYSFNCFTTTALGPMLVRAGVQTITITGIKTEQCCETTARVGCDLGFDVDYVTECTMTFPIRKPNGGMLSTNDIIERTELALRDRFARIKTVDESIAGLHGLPAVSIVSMC